MHAISFLRILRNGTIKTVNNCITCIKPVPQKSKELNAHIIVQRSIERFIIDFIDIRSYFNENGDNRRILTVIDVYS